MDTYYVLSLTRNEDITQPMLRMVWERILEESLVPVLFYDGSIQTWPQFLECMTRQGGCPFVIIRKANPVMFAWVNDTEGQSMRMHFTMFRDSWGEKRHAAAIARHLLEFVLTRKDEQGFLIDTIVGVTPTSNRLACRFVQRVGLTKLGVIPHAISLYYEDGRTDDAMVTYATRETLGLQPDEDVRAIWNV